MISLEKLSQQTGKLPINGILVRLKTSALNAAHRRDMLFGFVEMALNVMDADKKKAPTDSRRLYLRGQIMRQYLNILYCIQTSVCCKISKRVSYGEVLQHNSQADSG